MGSHTEHDNNPYEFWNAFGEHFGTQCDHLGNFGAESLEAEFDGKPSQQQPGQQTNSLYLAQKPSIYCIYYTGTVSTYS